jgi:Holliday junction DNA helicase RuvA
MIGAMTLYGFASKDEQRLFDLLTTVNGVGPRLALSILGSNDVPAIVAAIKSEKVEQFTKISRLGKKIASRIVIDLKGKVEDVFPHVGASAAASAGARAIPQGDLALEALVELGYSEPQARAALSDINEAEPGARVRAALKILAPHAALRS